MKAFGSWTQTHARIRALEKGHVNGVDAYASQDGQVQTVQCQHVQGRFATIANTNLIPSVISVLGMVIVGWEVNVFVMTVGLVQIVPRLHA